MNRKEKISRHIDPAGCGIETGPSHNPVAPKRDGYRVDVIDHLSREDLVIKYEGHGVNLNNIEDVDFVWRGESYSELTGRKKFYDRIIASHVIEHSLDLIGFLKDCDEVLKDDGALSLVIPDKRYCFDRFRPISGISKIIDSHFRKDMVHSAGTVAEHHLNAVSMGGEISWNKYSKGKYEFVHTMNSAVQTMEAALSEGAYLDVHAWCFVPHSFRLLIHDLFCLGFIPFQEVEFFETEGAEFYVTLERSGKGIPLSRLELLEKMESELRMEGSAGAPDDGAKRSMGEAWRWLVYNSMLGRFPMLQKGALAVRRDGLGQCFTRAARCFKRKV